MGSLPAVLGLIVLFIVFGLANERFTSALNLANLVTQAGSICVLAMGLVFVLLLGDIDLSAGVAGGVSACAMALAITNHGWPWWAAMLAGVLCGALIGLAIGLLRAKLGIPSFVVTLAFFLGLQGVTLKLIGEGGSVRVDDPVIRGITIDSLPVAVGWACALLVVVGYAGLELFRHRSKVAAGLAPCAVRGRRHAHRRRRRRNPRRHLPAQPQPQRQRERRDPRHPLRTADGRAAAHRVDVRADPHLVRSAPLRRRWQRGGGSACGHQRRPDPDFGVRGVFGTRGASAGSSRRPTAARCPPPRAQATSCYMRSAPR